MVQMAHHTGHLMSPAIGGGLAQVGSYIIIFLDCSSISYLEFTLDKHASYIASLLVLKRYLPIIL